MQPKYSILYFNQDLNRYLGDIDRYLMTGIKVFWFGSRSDADRLKAEYEPFQKALFLQAFSVEDVPEARIMPAEIAIDGEEIDGSKKYLIDWLDQYVPAFNNAQYRVEHCAADRNIVVKASAGTGKTTVMIDRILYLMHMVPGLDMSEIYMITFTNEATNQMNAKLQEKLLSKYSLTKNKRYLTWLEQQSQMHISTIDSLAYDLFKRFGTGVGFGRDLEIKPLEKERKDMIKDLLSDSLSTRSAIKSQIGMTYPEASRLIDDYYKELTRKGYSINEILNQNWGHTGTPVTENFQDVLITVLGQFEESYKQLKLDENAISINDLFFDFGHYLLDGKIDCRGLDMKYLFVDEFQDTDATQIRTFARLTKRIGAGLFVVGDVKQSIYGFKGATDAAFDILEDEMRGDLTTFSLRNNYRTSANVMRAMEKYFFTWEREGLLRYEEAVRPFNKKEGEVWSESFRSKSDQEILTVNLISDALSELELEVRSGRKKVSNSTKVAVLVRGRTAADTVAKLCRSHGMNVVLRTDSPFFLSDAVRDFYAMISSYIFTDHPIYLYNYLMSPYASFEGKISPAEMERFRGDEEKNLEYLGVFLSQTNWHKYQREFRLRPVLSVIREILEQEHVVENYIALDKNRMRGTDFTEAKKNKQALIDAKSYRLNLDKLMEMIEQRMDGQFATIYDLYAYLSLMIATNREEMEPDPELVNDYTSVYIMTVHKSKGLEFDTVILPSMSAPLDPPDKTTIMTDGEKLAWYVKKDPGERVNSQMITISNPRAMTKSQWYDELREDFVRKTAEEETRILYVAMTRAVNRLIMLVNDWHHNDWSGLIRKAGLTNE